MEKIYSIQHLRGIAALGVVFHHAVSRTFVVYTGESYSPWGGGAAGVDLFFVISGYIMMRITTQRERPPSPVDFALRRLMRVGPLYWLFTCLAAVLINFNSFWFSGAGGWEAFFRSLLFIPDMIRDGHHQTYPLIIPGWSLNMEVPFYLMLAAALAFGRSYVVMIVVMLCMLFSTSYLVADGRWEYFGFYAQGNGVIMEFALGILAFYLARDHGLHPTLGVAIAAAGTALLVALSWPRYSEDLRFFTAGIPSLMIVLGAVISEPLFKGLWSRRLSIFGDASYSTYLVHLFFIVPALRGARVLGRALTDRVPLPLTLAFVIVVCIALGLLVHLAIERPLLAWLHARLPSKDSRAQYPVVEPHDTGQGAR